MWSVNVLPKAKFSKSTASILVVEAFTISISEGAFNIIYYFVLKSKTLKCLINKYLFVFLFV